MAPTQPSSAVAGTASGSQGAIAPRQLVRQTSNAAPRQLNQGTNPSMTPAQSIPVPEGIRKKTVARASGSGTQRGGGLRTTVPRKSSADAIEISICDGLAQPFKDAQAQSAQQHQELLSAFGHRTVGSSSGTVDTNQEISRQQFKIREEQADSLGSIATLIQEGFANIVPFLTTIRDGTGFAVDATASERNSDLPQVSITCCFACSM